MVFISEIPDGFSDGIQMVFHGISIPWFLFAKFQMDFPMESRWFSMESRNHGFYLQNSRWNPDGFPWNTDAMVFICKIPDEFFDGIHIDFHGTLIPWFSMDSGYLPW